MPDLTRRQLQIVALLGVGGLSPKEIQVKLGITSSTYYQHLHGAERCMGVKTPWQLMYLAGLQIARGLEGAQGEAR